MREYEKYIQWYRSLNTKQKKRFSKNKPIEIGTKCAICKKQAHTMHELIHGQNRRIASIYYKLQIPVCSACHTNIHEHDFELDKKLKQQGQQLFEEQYSHEDYMNIFKINYSE